MRYYDIQVTDPDTGKKLDDFCFSSVLNGVFNPNCLMVEFDIQKYGMSTPAGECLVRVYGLDQKSMMQANQNLPGKTISVSVGMMPGLPLATAAYNEKQYGLVLEGTIWQAYGNWQGINLSLDMIIRYGPVASSSNPTGPMNVTLPWKKGQKLSVALTQCFQVGFPSYTPVINISDNLILSYDSPMFCGTLESLSSYLNSMSKSIIRQPDYSGVEIAVVGKEIKAWDNLGNPVKQNKIKKINFNDLNGQPNWIRPQTVMLTMVMRADINVGDDIKMPKEAVQTVINLPGSLPNYRNKSAFAGVFRVTSVRIIGNSRIPDASGWTTVIEAITT
ncbi:hypothetical protein [Mangrovibacter phragmitis]|uniref:hypothetical protein n=1 Tax=Mangrovibacter phragmitis TaxID=1691903 RepID=UPI00336A8BA1